MNSVSIGCARDLSLLSNKDREEIVSTMPPYVLLLIAFRTKNRKLFEDICKSHSSELQSQNNNASPTPVFLQSWALKLLIRYVGINAIRSGLFTYIRNNKHLLLKHCLHQEEGKIILKGPTNRERIYWLIHTMGPGKEIFKPLIKAIGIDTLIKDMFYESNSYIGSVYVLYNLQKQLRNGKDIILPTATPQQTDERMIRNFYLGCDHKYKSFAKKLFCKKMISHLSKLNTESLLRIYDTHQDLVVGTYIISKIWGSAVAKLLIMHTCYNTDSPYNSYVEQITRNKILRLALRRSFEIYPIMKSSNYRCRYKVIKFIPSIYVNKLCTKMALYYV